MAGRREEEGDNELEAMMNRLPGDHVCFTMKLLSTCTKYASKTLIRWTVLFNQRGIDRDVALDLSI